jgi:predicted Holliday junction resolvase-like endonuclease
MRTFFKTIFVTVSVILAVIVFLNLRARMEEQDRLAAIDRAIEEKKAALEAEIAYRNPLAEQAVNQALRSEHEAQARWDSAKDRAKLPGNNTVESYTPVTTNYVPSQGGRR